MVNEMIDRVYQKVLAIANKEQRGYITPQEFNLFADHAQMDIFEQYFYDLSQQKRRPSSNNSLDKDPVEIIEQKLLNFKTKQNIDWDYSLSGILNFYRIESITATSLYNPPIYIEEIDRAVAIEIGTHLPLLKPSKRRLCYYTEDGHIHIHKPAGEDMADYSVQLSYTKRPAKPNWTYLIDPTTKNALYNPDAGDYKDFELHLSEENNLVIKILQLAGVSIKDVNLTQYSLGKEVATEQKQKQ